VRQALAILEALAGGDGLTLTGLSDQLGLPKNAVFRITRTLLAHGYVDRDPGTLRFRLTPKFLTLGQPRGAGKTLGETALPEMRRLRDECLETVQLGVWSGDCGVVVEVVDGLHPLRIAVEVGLRFPLHNNAPGKCLLAHLPAADRDAAVGRLDLVASTVRTITDPDEIRRECGRVTARGYATDHAEADEGIHCVAAPVFDRRRRCVATVWVSGPSRRMPKEAFAVLGRQVRRAADAITESFSL
jgi:DNA-binding IclR family transcriptional regulator